MDWEKELRAHVQRNFACSLTSTGIVSLLTFVAGYAWMLALMGPGLLSQIANGNYGVSIFILIMIISCPLVMLSLTLTLPGEYIILWGGVAVIIQKIGGFLGSNVPLLIPIVGGFIAAKLSIIVFPAIVSKLDIYLVKNASPKSIKFLSKLRFYRTRLMYGDVEGRKISDKIFHAVISITWRLFGFNVEEEALKTLRYNKLFLELYLANMETRLSGKESTEREQQDEPEDFVSEPILHSLKDYFKILAMSPTFDLEAIKRQYYERIKKYHPDRVQSLGHEFITLAEEKTKSINQAYQTITSKLKN